MTVEEKQLLLKDLCARLSYGVKLQCGGILIGKTHQRYMKERCDATLYSITEVYDNCYAINARYDLIEVKPYLRPISSMTEEEMDMLFDILHINKDGKDDDWIKINDVYGIKFFFPSGKWIENVAEVYDYLYSIHIDFRGLIRKGLAIEITKENNLYEE